MPAASQKSDAIGRRPSACGSTMRALCRAPAGYTHGTTCVRARASRGAPRPAPHCLVDNKRTSPQNNFRRCIKRSRCSVVNLHNYRGRGKEPLLTRRTWPPTRTARTRRRQLRPSSSSRSACCALLSLKRLSPTYPLWLRAAHCLRRRQNGVCACQGLLCSKAPAQAVGRRKGQAAWIHNYAARVAGTAGGGQRGLSGPACVVRP